MYKSQAVLLAIITAISAFTVGCTENDTGEDTAGNQGQDTSITEPVTEPAEQLGLDADLNYNGYTFRILSRPGSRLNEVWSETETGDVLSDSVYRRNIIVEDLLNIKFEVLSSSGDFETDALNPILAGDDAYDAVGTAARAAFIYAQSSAAVNWYEISNIDLERSWWSSDASSNLSINNKLYAMCGDISYATLSSSTGMVFNKQLFDEYQLEYPYELVREGLWTFGEFSKLAKNFSQDLNGDGQMTIDADLFGYSTNHWCGPINVLYSTGERIITVDSDGYPQLTLYSEKVVDIYERFMSLLLSECGYNQLGGNDHQKAFCEGRVGLVDLNISHLSESFFREAEVDFGLIPWPKSDESVDKYYSYVDAGQTLWIVPVTVTDLARSGAVLEAMAYYGQQEIIPAYYDITLQNKYLRDDTSVEMLDYIREGAVFDLGYYNNSQFGGALANPGYDLVHDTTLSFTTLYAQNEQAVKTLIDESMESYLS